MSDTLPGKQISVHRRLMQIKETKVDIVLQNDGTRARALPSSTSTGSSSRTFPARSNCIWSSNGLSASSHTCFIEVSLNFTAGSGKLKEEQDSPATDVGHLELLPSLLELGDVVTMGTGDIVPADGILLGDGDYAFDESVLTGESIPVAKKAGDTVYEGSRLCSASARVMVKTLGQSTVMGQIISTVRAASACTSPSGLFADKISLYFLPGVFLIALSTIFVWSVLVVNQWVVLPVDLLDEETPRLVRMASKVMFVMKFGLSTLAIACPCALGLATPTAIAVATGRALKMGILIKNGAAFEKSAKVKVVVLDKTGTITSGQLKVASEHVDYVNVRRLIHQISGDSNDATANYPVELLAAFVWKAVALIEQGVDHPVGQSLLRYIRSPFSVCSLPEIPSRLDVALRDKDLSSGNCAVGTLELPNVATQSGFTICVGSLASYQAKCHALNISAPSVDNLDEGIGNTVVVFTNDAQLLASVKLIDAIRDDAPAAISYLRKHMKTDVYMCTGDVPSVAHQVGDEVGLNCNQICAEATPTLKQRFVDSVRSKGTVVMCGDGTNDSLALVGADVGIAMGAQTQIVNVAADVTLQNEE